MGSSLSAIQQKVLGLIDQEGLVELTLRLAAHPTRTGEEREVAEMVFDWLRGEGIEARKLALLPERPNILGVLPGTGGGLSLIFNSHMDVGITPEDTGILARPERRQEIPLVQRELQGLDGPLAAEAPERLDR